MVSIQYHYQYEERFRIYSVWFLYYQNNDFRSAGDGITSACSGML